MSDAKLQAAKELIQEKAYEAARAILKTLPDDPTAIKWLAQLDQFVPPTPEPSRQAPIEKSSTQWEYCAVGSIKSVEAKMGVDVGNPLLITFTRKGANIQSLKGGETSVAEMIARLGEEGWEMVGTGNVFATTTITGTGGVPGHLVYFKRPISR